VAPLSRRCHQKPQNLRLTAFSKFVSPVYCLFPSLLRVISPPAADTCQDIDAIADAVFGFNISDLVDASLRYDWTAEDGGWGEVYVGVTNCTGPAVVRFSMDDRHVGTCNPINGTLDVFGLFDFPYAFGIDVLSLHDSSAVSTMVSTIVAGGALALAAMLVF
jgi:hypothetical protein